MITYPQTRKISIGFFCSLLLAWGWFSGKDINWDFLNYHLYSSYLMVGDRWEKDFFAASVQSYLNPISYIPIYFMVMSGIPDILMALALISPGLFSVWLLWKLSEELVPDPENNISIILLMVALASTTSLWLIVVGSTFNDSLSCAITLGSLLLLLKSTRKKWIRLAFAGGLAGISVGIKLTNGSYILPILMMYFFLQRKESCKNIIQGAFILGGGIIIGFLMAHGYWSWKLWGEFGNPFFPFFNGVFQSSDFLPENLQDRRFMGDSWIGIFTLPFKMPMMQPWIYNEASAPEIKMAIVFSLMPVAAIIYLFNKFSEKISENYQSTEKLIAVTLFILVSYGIWSTSSRIGRYAIFVWMSAGVIIPAWLYLIFNQSVARILSLFFLIIQCFLNATAGITHWSPVAWGGEWFRPEIPKILTEKPHTVITTALQTFSAIAPFTHPENRWSSVTGQYILPSGDKIPSRLKRNLQAGNVIAIIPATEGGGDVYNGPNEIERKIINDLFLNYGLWSKNFECAPIKIRQMAITPWSGSKNQSIIMLHACAMAAAEPEVVAIRQAQIAQYDTVLNSIEDQCPQLFSPKRSNSFSVDNEFSRFYFNTSIHLYTEGDTVLAKLPQQLSRQVITLVDRTNGKIKSEISCPTFPKKLYLD